MPYNPEPSQDWLDDQPVNRESRVAVTVNHAYKGKFKFVRFEGISRVVVEERRLADSMPLLMTIADRGDKLLRLEQALRTIWDESLEVFLEAAPDGNKKRIKLRGVKV